MIGFVARAGIGLSKTLLAFAVAWPIFLGLARESEDDAIGRDLRAAAGRIEGLLRAALDEGDLDGAAAYAALAPTLGQPIPAELLARLDQARATADTPAAQARRCAEGALTGTMTDGISVACTLAADFTVFGDLRDLVVQGSRWAAGQDYDAVLVGLSAVGLGATAVTVASAGSAAPARAGLSLVKAAKRAGQVPPALGKAVAAELRIVARGGNPARLTHAAGAVDAVRAEHGTAEAMRMLRHAGSVEELGDVASMYGRFGRLARPVMALTGKTSIHAFKAGYKLAPTLLPSLTMLCGGMAALLLGLSLHRRIERWRRRPGMVRRKEPALV